MHSVFHLLMGEVLVQAVIAAIQKALITDDAGKRVGPNTLIADMADLDALIFEHVCLPIKNSQL